MMSLKKLPVVLVASLALLTSACQGSPDEQTTIRFATTLGNQEVMHSIITQFEEANPEIKVEAVYSATDLYTSAMVEELATGKAPDVFTLAPGVGSPLSLDALVSDGRLADLGDTEWSGKLPTGLDPMTTVDGVRYALTHDASGIGVIFNGSSVEAAGATLPNTWTEVLQFCADARAADTVAFALGAKTAWNAQLISYALASTLVYADDPAFDAEQANGAATFSDSAWSDALAKYQQMQDTGCFPDDPTRVSYEDAAWMVAKGGALAIVLPSSSLPTVREETPEDERLGIFALPASDDPFATTMPISAGALYALNAGSAQPEAARTFLEFMASDPIQSQYIRDMGGIPAWTPKNFQYEAARVAVVPYLDEQRSNPTPDLLWPNSQVQSAHMKGVQSMLAGEASAADVLAAMDEAYQQGATNPA